MSEALAPGKLIICGEYAVLEGAPAIAVAVEAEARARVESSAEGMLTVAGVGSWPYACDGAGGLRWLEREPGDPARVLEAVAATLAAAGQPLVVPLDIRLDSSAFRAPAAAEKLGLGSSAAITVALLTALPGLRETSRDRLFTLGVEAHRRFQGGAGSGLDVAAAVYGGVVVLEPAHRPLPRALAWPAGLHWMAVWSGHGASTVALLSRLQRFRERAAAPCARLLENLGRVAVMALSAWEGGDAREVLSALAAYRESLAALDAAGGIGIFTTTHRELAALAEQHGAVYKTSGAGGGDFGLVFADTRDVIADVARDCRQRGLLTLPGRADVPGARITAVS